MKENKKPNVSIIIPMYNVEKYIQQCIESCINQTEKNIEIIIINDESPDLSLNIANEYAKKDSRIKIIDQKNSGVSVARNKGLEISSSDWIMFVDGDDWLEKDAVEKMYKYAKTNKYDVVISGFYDSTEEKKEERHFFDKKELIFKKNNIDIIKSCIYKSRITGKNLITNVGVPWAKLYKKSFLINNNCKFEIGLKRMQDMVFNLKTLYIANKIICIEPCTYNYRKNIESSTHKYTSDFSKTSIKILDCIKKFIEQYNLEDELNEYYLLKMFLLYKETLILQILPQKNEMSNLKKIKEMKRIYKEYGINGINKKDIGKYLSLREKRLMFLIKMKMFIVAYIYEFRHYKKINER